MSGLQCGLVCASKTSESPLWRHRMLMGCLSLCLVSQMVGAQIFIFCLHKWFYWYDHMRCQLCPVHLSSMFSKNSPNYSLCWGISFLGFYYYSYLGLRSPASVKSSLINMNNPKVVLSYSSVDAHTTATIFHILKHNTTASNKTPKVGLITELLYY